MTQITPSDLYLANFSVDVTTAIMSDIQNISKAKFWFLLVQVV
jgi:hypothetical protein